MKGLYGQLEIARDRLFPSAASEPPKTMLPIDDLQWSKIVDAELQAARHFEKVATPAVLLDTN